MIRRCFFVNPSQDLRNQLATNSSRLIYDSNWGVNERIGYLIHCPDLERTVENERPRLVEIRRGEQPEKEAQRETMNGPVTLAVRGSAPAKLHKSESAARNVKLASTRASTITSITKHNLVLNLSRYTTLLLLVSQQCNSCYIFYVVCWTSYLCSLNIVLTVWIKSKQYVIMCIISSGSDVKISFLKLTLSRWAVTKVAS